MSSVGHIHREATILKKTETSAGSDSAKFHVENDGFLITIQRTAGTGNLYFNLWSEHPGEIDDIQLGSTTTVDDGLPTQQAFLCGAVGRIDMSWQDDVSFSVSVKLLTGSGVQLYKDQIAGECVDEPVATKTNQLAMLERLDASVKCNKKILNHMRQITGVEAEEGKDF